MGFHCQQEFFCLGRQQILAIWKGNNQGGKPNIQEYFQAQHSMEHTCSQDEIEPIPQTGSSTHVQYNYVEQSGS